MISIDSTKCFLKDNKLSIASTAILAISVALTTIGMLAVLGVSGMGSIAAIGTIAAISLMAGGGTIALISLLLILKSCIFTNKRLNQWVKQSQTTPLEKGFQEGFSIIHENTFKEVLKDYRMPKLDFNNAKQVATKMNSVQTTSLFHHHTEGFFAIGDSYSEEYLLGITSLNKENNKVHFWIIYNPLRNSVRMTEKVDLYWNETNLEELRKSEIKCGKDAEKIIGPILILDCLNKYA